MSLYRIHFKWKEKEIVLSAKSLDMTHPYFVSIKNIIFPKEQKIIIDPNEEDVRKTFGEAEHIMIPFQSVTLIEELDEKDALAKDNEEKVVSLEEIHEVKKSEQE